jgi:hypothetical protein
MTAHEDYSCYVSDLPPSIAKFFRDRLHYWVDDDGFVCDPADEYEEENKSEYQNSWYSEEKIKKVFVELVPEGYKVVCPYCEYDLIQPWNPSGDWKVCGNCNNAFYIQRFIFWDGIGFTGLEELEI